jgi:hypothetical protein
MKFGIREAVDVVFKALAPVTIGSTTFAKGEPVLYFDSLKTSTTEGTATTVYAQGGRGNPRLIAWEGDKAITFSFEDALISAEGMAILTGAGLLEAGSDNKIRVHQKATVTGTIEAKKVTVVLTDAMPANGTLVTEDIFGFILDNNEEISERLGAGTGTAASVQFANETEATGTVTVLVDYYVDMTAGAKEITITADQFAGYYYIEGDTLFRRQADGVDLPAQLVIPNAKIQTNFTFTMAPSGDPSTFTFTADAFPGKVKGNKTNKVLYALQIIEDPGE